MGVYEVRTWQRFLLLLIHCPLWVFYKPIDFMHNLYFDSAMWSLFTAAVVFNFPRGVVMLQSKPMYFSDLSSNNEIHVSDRQRYQRIFLMCQQVLLIIGIPTIIDYYVLRYPDLTRRDAFELAVLTYGALSMVYTVASYTGSLLMALTSTCREKSTPRSRGIYPQTPLNDGFSLSSI